MLQKTITFEDFDGNTRTETHYFHFSKAEIIRLQLETVTKENPEGDMTEDMRDAVESGNGKRIMDTFRRWILEAYGLRSEDGRSFRKSKEISEEFASTAAYGALFLELISDPGAAEAFVKGLFPANLIKEAQRLNAPQDHLSKQDTRANHRVEQVATPESVTYVPKTDPYQEELRTAEPVLAPGVQQVKYTHEEITSLSEFDYENLLRRYRGWTREGNHKGDVIFTPPQTGTDAPAVEGLITRPPHESGPGYQVD